MKGYNGKQSLRKYCDDIINSKSMPYTINLGKIEYFVNYDYIQVTYEGKLQYKTNKPRLGLLVAIADQVLNQ